MSLIPSMNEEESAKYKELVIAAKEAKETGKRQQFPCVGLENVVYWIDSEGNVYDKDDEFVMTYRAEVLKGMPDDNN